MDINEAIQKRHSVRKYTDREIDKDTVKILNEEIVKSNKESGLHIQLVTNEPEAFNSFMAHYGKFDGVRNYIALVGKKEDGLDEKVGYYGEQIVLKAQQQGLNTCWVAMTFSKRKSRYIKDRDEKLICVLALGYGAEHGTAHKSKDIDSLCHYEGVMPDWFKNGMEAAMLAPTATNQQKFLLSFSGKNVKVESKGGFYSKVDLGIVKYHFETGAGKANFKWMQ